MKSSRQSVILDIIAHQDIETQADLIQALEEQGITSTQATISRDIRQLRLTKELSPEGVYRYVQVADESQSDSGQRMESFLRSGCLSVDHALHTVVLRTVPGAAAAVCAALDSMDINGALGTIAGYDTGVLYMRNAALAERTCQQLKKMLALC